MLFLRYITRISVLHPVKPDMDFEKYDKDLQPDGNFRDAVNLLKCKKMIRLKLFFFQ
jgi:hypothetical protein